MRTLSPLESRLRLGTGLVLAIFVLQHVINHAFGIISIEAAEAYRETVGQMFQHPPGQLLLYGSVLIHVGIALRSLYYRSSLRMSLWQWLQLLLGLSLPFLIAGHVVGNRGYDMLGAIDPNYYYVISSMLLVPAILLKPVLALLVIWLHLMIGLHFWLRVKKAYPPFIPYLYALAILVPALAYTGLVNMLQQGSAWIDDQARLDEIYAAKNAMAAADLEFLQSLELRVWITFAAIIALVLVARQLRLWLQLRRGTYQISRDDGSKIRAIAGISLLDALRNARIPHAAVCGGRARCTTCRVRIGTGLENLPAPGELEQRALSRINAADDIRLACQIFPQSDLAITPLVLAGQPLAGALHTGGVQGHEEYVVAMFVDMRGSTNLGERVLAYDVVFILNRFFTELSSALAGSHGHYAQFAGDGLMALYGLQAERKERACRDALAGAAEMFRRIDSLNQQLQLEFGESVKMGIGLHGGDAIVGTMGPPRTPLLTAVGDNINIAARLEAQTKNLGCDLIVSTTTLEREGIDFPTACVDEIEVRGRENHVRICRFDRDNLPNTASD